MQKDDNIKKYLEEELDKERIAYPEIQIFECKECENDMKMEMFYRSPETGAHLICQGCDREIEVIGEEDTVII